jgi:hypothetical protein
MDDEDSPEVSNSEFMPLADIPKHSSLQTIEVNKKLSKEVKTQPVIRGELDQLKAAVRPAPPPVILQLSSHPPRQVLNTHRTISLPLLSQDDSFPLTNTSRNKFVEQLLNSMRDIREADDSVSLTRDFKTRWLKPGLKGEYIYDELDMERVCRDLVSIAEILHAYGLGSTRIYDPSTIEKILASKPLSFEDHISRLAYLMRKSKARCDMFMLGNTLEDTVVLIATKVRAQKSNTTNNPSRSSRLRESKKVLGISKRSKRSKSAKAFVAPSDTSKEDSKTSDVADDGIEDPELGFTPSNHLNSANRIQEDNSIMGSPATFAHFLSGPTNTSSRQESPLSPVEQTFYFSNSNPAGAHVQKSDQCDRDQMTFAGIVDFDSIDQDQPEPSAYSMNADATAGQLRFEKSLASRLPDIVDSPTTHNAMHTSNFPFNSESNVRYSYPQSSSTYEDASVFDTPDIFWDGTGEDSFGLANPSAQESNMNLASISGGRVHSLDTYGGQDTEDSSRSTKRPRRKQPTDETVNSMFRGRTAPKAVKRDSHSSR